MPYFAYKTTNRINGKFYIGVHKSDNIETDPYLGSGKRLKYALAKYGIENFEREILASFDTAEEAFKLEAELVTEELLDSGECYNIKLGGMGGFDHLNYGDARDKNLRITDPDWNRKNSPFCQEFHDNLTPEQKEKIREGSRKAAQKTIVTLAERYPEGTFKGRRHTDETKERMRQKAIKRLADPTKNGSYGTMWITDGIDNRKIQKDAAIPEGWKRGRV